ncbi:PE family protein [Mycobacterium kiyosense]
MSVLIVPEIVEAAAEQLAGIRTTLADISTAALSATTEVAPAAADEVSVAIAKLFGTFGSEYQAINAQATAYHEDFVALLTRGATAYAAAEALNVSALLDLGQLVTAFEIGVGNLATQFSGALNAAFGLGGIGGSISGTGSLGLNAATALRALTALPTLGAGLALQTGGALTSGLGSGLAQAGQLITNAGVALGNAGALLSVTGAGLTAQGNAALEALLSGSLGATLTASLTANFNAMLPSLAELGQTGGLLIANISAALGALPTLGANIAGAFQGGLDTLLNLAGNFTLPPFTFPTLPPFTFPSLPNLGAIISGSIDAGINGLVNLAGSFTLPPFALPPFTFPTLPPFTLPNIGGAINAGISGLVNLAAQLPSLTLPPFTFPSLPRSPCRRSPCPTSAGPSTPVSAGWSTWAPTWQPNCRR